MQLTNSQTEVVFSSWLKLFAATTHVLRRMLLRVLQQFGPFNTVYVVQT